MNAREGSKIDEGMTSNRDLRHCNISSDQTRKISSWIWLFWRTCWLDLFHVAAAALALALAGGFHYYCRTFDIGDMQCFGHLESSISASHSVHRRCVLRFRENNRQDCKSPGRRDQVHWEMALNFQANPSKCIGRWRHRTQGRTV